MKDYFTILGISRSATEEEIKDAYRNLAKKWHPDSNEGSPDAARTMQDLNRAKEVLFQKETREEYLRVLRLQDTITPEYVQRAARRYVRDYDRTPRTLASLPKFDKKKFTFVFIFFALLVIGAGYFISVTISSALPEPADPVQAILDRQQTLGTTPRQVLDTIQVPNLPADRLSQMAAFLVMMEEHQSAAKYWEEALEKDTTNAEIFTNLLLSLLRRYEYQKAFNLVEDFVKGDHDRIIIWDKIGEYFLVEGRRRDARDAFRNALIFAAKVRFPDEELSRHIENAKSHIDSY